MLSSLKVWSIPDNLKRRRHAAQYTLLERAMFDDDLDAKSRAYTTRADVLYKLGDGAGTKSAFRQAEEASQHTKGNDTTRRLETLLYLNQVLFRAREIEAARRIADQVLATARKADNATTHQYFFLRAALQLAEFGDADQAFHAAEAAQTAKKSAKGNEQVTIGGGLQQKEGGPIQMVPTMDSPKESYAQILGHIVDLKASVKAENKAEAKQAAERALTTVRAHGDILFSYPIFPEFSKAIILSGEGSALRQFAQNVTDPMSQFRAHSQLAVALAEVGVLLAKVGKVQEASKKVQGASDEARSAQEAADRMGDRKLRLKNLAEWARDLAPNMPLSAETVARKVLAEVDPASDDSEVRANALAALVETSVRNQKPETARDFADRIPQGTKTSRAIKSRAYARVAQGMALRSKYGTAREIAERCSVPKEKHEAFSWILLYYAKKYHPQRASAIESAAYLPSDTQVFPSNLIPSKLSASIAMVDPEQNGEGGLHIGGANDGEHFLGTTRRAAKTSVAQAENETFSSVGALLNALLNKEEPAAQEVRLRAKLTPDSPRISEEKRNVTVHSYLYAAKKEADNDFHLLLGDGSDTPQPRFITAEVSGLPNPSDSTDKPVLESARNQFKAFFQQGFGLPGNRYVRFDPPIPLTVSGSVFFDIDHRPGQHRTGNILTETVWEIHPVSAIIFEPRATEPAVPGRGSD